MADALGSPANRRYERLAIRDAEVVDEPNAREEVGK
jgi:hypothetical protein